jgi:phage terminase Nu1 subunit (DNA packaging protein)
MNMASAAQCARHIFLSERRFHQMVDAGIFKRSPRGSYNLDVIREVAFKRLRDEVNARGDNSNTLTEQRTRIAKAKANNEERKDRRDAGELVEIGAVTKLVNVERSVVHDKLLGMGGKLQGQIGIEHAALVDTEAREILTELSDADDLVRQAANVAAGFGDEHDAAVAALKKEEGHG